MIHHIQLESNSEILELLSLQLAAYRVEAELIGLDEIPPLKDGIPSIREADETFIGYYLPEDSAKILVGAISYKREGCAVTICRLMVHPDYFRRGIARKLLGFVIDGQKQGGAPRFIVSTGSANKPALQLYFSFGFKERSVRTVSPGILLATLERSADATEINS